MLGSHPGDGAVSGTLARKPRPTATRQHLLRLFVTGMTLTSHRAIERVRAFCEEHMPGRYQLEVIDIYQLPELAREEQIIATPTLIKVLPLPLRRFIGNMANLDKILLGMDLRERH